MNILFVTHGLYPCNIGGAEIFNFFLIKEIAKFHRIFVITCCKQEINLDATLIRIDPKTFGPATISVPLLDFFNIFKLRKEIDLIHLSYMGAKWLPWIPYQISKFFFNIPYTISIHGGGMYKWKVKSLHRYLFKNAAAIAGVSQIIKKEYEKRTDREIKVIPPLIPFKNCYEETRILRNRYGFGQKEIILLSIGSINKIKGSDTLLTAFTNLDLEFIGRYKLRLLYVGDGDMRKELEAFVKQKGFSVYVKFVGSIPYEQIPAMYKMADIYIIPSLFEGTPISMLEAMFNGMPIIGSDTNGINNIIDHGQNGLLFEVNNFIDLRNKIVHLIENKNFAYHIATNAKSTFEDKYNFDEVVSQYIKIYEKIGRNSKKC
jgi:glycosyltransferase involved in cell wall biosynthesis